MHGTNDAAVITGASTAELTETNAAQSTGGTSIATDVDSSSAFVAQTDAGRQQRLRQVLDRRRRRLDLHDEQRPRRVRGRHRTTPTASRWRRPTAPTQVITVTMHGTNDAAVITGTSTAELTETNAAQTHRRHAESPPTWTARTPSWRRPTLAGSNGYGKFSIDAAGAWTYTMNSAHDEFVGGQRLHRQHHGGDGRRHVAGHHRHHARHQRRGGDHRREHGRADRDQCGAEHRRHARSPPTWTARAPSWRRPTWPAATATASSRSTPPAPGPTR